MAGPNDIIIASLRGGYNDTDPPQDIGPDQCVQADNVEFFNASCGERRGGCASLDLTSSGLTGQGGIVHLSQWFPTNVVTSPEFVAIAATPGSSVAVARRDTGGTWHSISPGDAINNAAPDIFHINAQPLDANNFIPYHSAVDRLHLLDSSGNWRRAGLAQPAPPTVADTGSGSYSGKRYFRIRYVVMSGTAVLLRSEPSTSIAFIPSGTGSAARVTKPASISEGETHWELEASEDDANYYRIATTAVATTTFDDTNASSKTFPAIVAAAPTSNDGTSILYVLLSDQAAALNLTGTISNGSYGNPLGTISGRGWIGYDTGGFYIPSFPAMWTAGENWYASPDVATALEAASSGNSGNYEAVGFISDAIGAYLTIPSAKFVAVDGDRLIYAGHQTNADLQSTVGWTPVKNDPGAGNSERAPIVSTGGGDISTTVDLDNYDGGALTGIAASTYGTWYAFKWQRIYSASRTGDVSRAYDINTISTSRGAIPGSIVKATDTNGSGVIYFLDPFVGPCRMATGGVVSPIHGLRQTWKRVNLKATSTVCCVAYYPYKQQVIWWVSVDGGNAPTLGIKLQTSELQQLPIPGAYQYTGELSKGLSLITGLQGTAQCAATFTYTVGTLTTDIPFIGLTAPNFIQRTDSGTDDNGTPFTATIKSKPMFLTGLLNKFGIRRAAILATADPNGTVAINLIRDEGIEVSPVSTITPSLAPSSHGESQVILDYDDLRLSELKSIQVEITDAVPAREWGIQRIDLKPTIAERG